MSNPLETEDHVVDTDEVSGAASLLQKAQERRQKREAHLFLDVPTWGGDLIAEYRILNPDEMKRVATTALANNNGVKEPGANDIALINAMCVGLHVWDSEKEERVPITDEFGHVNYGRIANFLGKSHVIKNSADAVKYVMSERDPDNPDNYIVNLVAISLHAAEIQRWVRDPSKRRVNLEALLGEL